VVLSEVLKKETLQCTLSKGLVYCTYVQNYYYKEMEHPSDVHQLWFSKSFWMEVAQVVQINKGKQTNGSWNPLLNLTCLPWHVVAVKVTFGLH